MLVAKRRDSSVGTFFDSSSAKKCFDCSVEASFVELLTSTRVGSVTSI